MFLARRRERVLAAALAAVALTACSGGGTTPATSASPTTAAHGTPTPTDSQANTIIVSQGDPGWIVFTDPTNRFVFQAPVWMKDVTTQASGQDPLVRVALVNPFVPTTSVQVLVTPLEPGTTLDGFATTTVQRLAQIPGFQGVQDQRVTTLAGQPASLLDWSASSNGSTVVEREYLVVMNGRGYVVSMDTTPKLRDADFKTLGVMLGRFRFGGP